MRIFHKAEIPEPTPEPTPEPSPEPVKVDWGERSNKIVIVQQPQQENVKLHGYTQFVSIAENMKKTKWYFLSPQQDRAIAWDDETLQEQFPGLECTGGNWRTFEIWGIPEELGGWYVVCVYKDEDGKALPTDYVMITIRDDS
ncbi:MAG: hypothetical protein IKI69_07835 [Oscillospiraceae bacterium]|nr:hypothetical protein [Oscillospiraceae bacterium]